MPDPTPPRTMTWCGKPIAALTRVEAIQALEEMIGLFNGALAAWRRSLEIAQKLAPPECRCARSWLSEGGHEDGCPAGPSPSTSWPVDGQ